MSFISFSSSLNHITDLPSRRSSPYSRSEKGLEAERKVWDELVELWTKLAPETREILKA